jgi:hypothetical protein
MVTTVRLVVVVVIAILVIVVIVVVVEPRSLYRQCTRPPYCILAYTTARLHRHNSQTKDEELKDDQEITRT